MGRKIETLKIKHPRDSSVPLQINKADFNPRLHKLWQPKKAESAPPPPSTKPSLTSGRDWYLLMSSAGWREVKESAEAIGYDKPDGLSWEEAIPQIMAHEMEVLDGQAK